MWCTFIFLLTVLVRLLRAACKPKDELVLENLALRQQLTALKLGARKPRLHDAEIREPVRQMLRENNWGAPRILSELQTLGFVVSETTVSRYVRQFRQRNPDPDVLKRCIAFLRNQCVQPKAGAFSGS